MSRRGSSLCGIKPSSIGFPHLGAVHKTRLLSEKTLLFQQRNKVIRRGQRRLSPCRRRGRGRRNIEGWHSALLKRKRNACGLPPGAAGTSCSGGENSAAWCGPGVQNSQRLEYTEPASMGFPHLGQFIAFPPVLFKTKRLCLNKETKAQPSAVPLFLPGRRRPGPLKTAR